MPGASGSIGLIAVIATLAVGLTAAGAASATSARAAAAADSAALAAADAASGRESGVPCDRAGELARAAGAELASCALSGLIATVEVGVSFGVFTARAKARAGPPPDGD